MCVLFVVGHFILEVEIDEKINSNSDPVCSDSNILSSLREQHQSILGHIQYRLAGDVTKTYAIKNRWTMKAEDTISTLQKLREGNGEVIVEKGRDEEQTEESLASDYFMHSSIERDRRLLDERRVKWIARRMDMITTETKEKLLGMGVEYRINKQAVEKKPRPESLEEVKEMLRVEQYSMEVLLVCEVREWEQLFWNKFKVFLDQIDNDRLEEKERLTREWRADCWRRLNPQMQAALKRLADVDSECTDWFLEILDDNWASLINQFFEGVENPDIRVVSLSGLRSQIRDKGEEIRLRMENEIEDTEFRLKRGSDLGRFDQFWDDDLLFNCRYSPSKWLYLTRHSTVPLEVHSHALKGNKNIIHIIFGSMNPGFDVNRFLCDLPWVTSITPHWSVSVTMPAVRRDLLFICSTDNDLSTFAKEIKLDPPSTYIFSDAISSYSGKRGSNSRVLISFVAPTSGKTLTLRVKHSGKGVPLEVTLGSTQIQLSPSSKSSLTMDDITLYPTEVAGPFEFDLLSFEPEVRNDIFIRLIGSDEYRDHGHFLHDIELLDEDGLEYMPLYLGKSGNWKRRLTWNGEYWSF